MGIALFANAFSQCPGQIDVNFYTYAGVLNLFQGVTYGLSEGLLAPRSRR